MSLELPESDWKALRGFHKAGLERFCRQVLDEVHEQSGGNPLSHHQRYLDLFKYIERKDKELGQLFNDLRRSNALVHLCSLRSKSLLSEAEFNQFSQETRDRIEQLLSSGLA